MGGRGAGIGATAGIITARVGGSDINVAGTSDKSKINSAVIRGVPVGTTISWTDGNVQLSATKLTSEVFRGAKGTWDLKGSTVLDQEIANKIAYLPAGSKVKVR